MAARIELPFLYHTRTILRVSNRACRSRSRFVSSQAGSDAIEDGNPPLSSDEESFLKAKARSVSWSPIAPRSTSKNAETTISSTITASERRAFETMLRFAPKQTETASPKRRSSYAEAADTDIENILKIFTSSLRGHQSQRDGSHLAPKLDGNGVHLVARTERPDQQPPTEQHDPELGDQIGLGGKIDRGEGLSTSIQREATTTAEMTENSTAQVDIHSAPPVPEEGPIPEPRQGDILEQSLAETAIPSHPFSQLEESIQQAVRDHMHSISRALQDAAYSKAKRGDIAMWEVCESRIFSIATDLQPSSRRPLAGKEETPRYGGLRKFTFSREKSDDPRQMIEAAERELRLSSSISGTRVTEDTTNENSPLAGQHHISPSTPSPAQLAILQHTYPASILLALRLYMNFYPSSPYALLLLPRIRSLGTTSYVLGASPQFYNSLMSLVWLTRSSLREVDELLSEMERGGVEMDEGTYSVLGGIEEERALEMAREKAKEKEKGDESIGGGGRGAAWWKRQEQMLWFPRILDWLDIVAGRLAARERLV
ncbi:hypothetical protein Z517_11233 [Fonsecaea pedrosoi CBS 271.37]|uniref:Mtf2-like C-terminal domain-containing protein n=1 Tax=Fonsecaea pedrosoi CBS 271.37 TaxID=1442368 RepID=A0A0D2EQC3_9EURO|nr:uncharacterized protein Z517_11233 [Fonsecaea pedrosoi CBS 271.37]KIW76487.1 hypothetical protein Z517_11233 [Fonsecaea pedrosoi CBS 271.37]